MPFFTLHKKRPAAVLPIAKNFMFFHCLLDGMHITCAGALLLSKETTGYAGGTEKLKL